MRFGLNTRGGRGQRYGVDARQVYDPTVEGNMVAWFDMQDPAAYSVSGGVIDYFVNKVSSVQWTASGTARAAYEATGLNGLPCAHPDGTDDTYISTEAAVVNALQATTANPYTILFVFHADVADAQRSVLGAGNSGFSSNNTRIFGQNTDLSGRWAIISQRSTGTSPSMVYTRHPV